ncbi:L-threonine aldolase [Monaibacterium marinum]|uniref:L-threonine aldolase n=1 Tax=Pontivivens marinum TaxID=1690039 RepID=A0A2C9CP69_9RHOB|nr:beta-eliminating lyase-related protein [Monaibacterium marinum]SOH93124.1 L-threonine aldolase [Monaibacterium marinum]
MNFASDNSGPTHPKVWEALTRADAGYAMPYGNDPLSGDIANRLRALFDAPDAAIVLAATGTAANSLALACLCPPWGRIYCHDDAHIEQDECGAPEFFIGGGKLTLISGPDGQFSAQTLSDALAATASGVHSAAPAAVSLSNLSEAGTYWPLDEITAVVEIAHAAGLTVHLDGARLSNAMVAGGYTPAQVMATGIDALVFGGTKNGLPGVEAVILRDPAKQQELERRRKRAGHLFSKHRYLAAQMDAYLTDDLWHDLATAANDAAARFADGLRDAGAEMMFPVQGNQIFCRLPRAAHQRATAAGAQYYLTPDAPLEGDAHEMLGARLVCNWATTQEQIDAFLSTLKG